MHGVPMALAAMCLTVYMVLSAGGMVAGGFLASYTDPLNRSNAFTYDAAGRITQQTTPDNRNIGFTYDAKGNLAPIVEERKIPCTLVTLACTIKGQEGTP